MTHTFSTNAGFGYFHTTAVADNTFITDFLIFTTVALPVLARSENTLAEESVFFRFQCSVVNGFRFFYFSMGPLSDFLRRCQANLDRIKRNWLINFFICYFCHEWFPPYSTSSSKLSSTSTVSSSSDSCTSTSSSPENSCWLNP